MPRPQLHTVPTLAPLVVLPGRLIERALFATDYHRATGRIDVFDDDEAVRCCRFDHVPGDATLRVEYAGEGVVYVGDSRQGRLEYPDGRVAAASSAREPRDIPNWLLCPALAPIWGRPGEDWSVDSSSPQWVDDERFRLPLRALRPGQRDGYIEVRWPQAYLTRLTLGSEHYVLRELDWERTAQFG